MPLMMKKIIFANTEEEFQAELKEYFERPLPELKKEVDKPQIIFTDKPTDHGKFD